MGESFQKGKPKRYAGFSSAKEDMISNLPDSLLSEILLYIPTKESVRTSVLSKRWKSVWLLIPGLDLDTNEIPNYESFVGFVDKFLDLCKKQKSCLHNLKLRIRKAKGDPPCVTRWINFVIKAKLKLRHLDIEWDPVNRQCFELIPASLYTCESLIYLRLHWVFVGGFESVSLPRLKTVRLELNAYANERCLESLISSCPILEDLSIVRRINDGVKVLRVHSQTLTTLSLGYGFGKYGSGISSFDRVNSGVLIHAPRLKYLNFNDEITKRKIISNLDSLAKVDFGGFFDVQYYRDGAGVSKNQLARDFFTDISRVRNMILSRETMKFFLKPYLQVETLPQFCNMSFLEAAFCVCNVKILPTLLQSCPNLKSIVLCSGGSNQLLVRASMFVVIPQVCIEIKNRFSGSCVEFEVAKYFVENSVVLNKLLVSCSIWMETQSLAVLRNLLALSKPSSVCQIVYVADADS